MSTQHPRRVSRRRFLGGLTLAGTGGLLGVHPRPVAAEPPPAVTTLRLTASKPGGLCIAPKYGAEALLQPEGFPAIHSTAEQHMPHRMQHLASGETDLECTFGGPFITRRDAGAPILVLAGGHSGCVELVGTEPVRPPRARKGKTVAVTSLGDAEHAFLASIGAYVGLAPQKDIHWGTPPPVESMRLLAAGTIDAILATPPRAQALRAQQIGPVGVNSTVDRPWSQDFCGLVAGPRECVRTRPVATKRALRARLKAANVCALEPERAARFLVDKGYVQRYDEALQTMQELPYGKWREDAPEETIRCYALRLHEAGMIKSTPQKIIAQGTDWRFFNELKRELKGERGRRQERGAGA